MEKKFHINLDDSAFTKPRSPVKPLFQPSSKVGQSASPSSTSSGTAAPRPAGQPTYAEFVVQRKGAAPPQNEGPSRVPAATAEPRADPETHAGPDRAAASPSEGGEEDQDRPTGTEGLGCGSGGTPMVTEGEEGQRSEGTNTLVLPKPVGSGNSIMVSPRQRGNPILKFVRSVPWEFGEIVPDYVLGQTTCALFLSLRYHNLNPNYIHDRLKQLGQTFTLRVLLVQVDVKDPHHSLKELARICMLSDCTLILAWSPEEAGRYLETYKSYENKPADLLKEHVEKDYLSKVTDCLTTVKSVNKTDSITLLSTFSSLEGIINASKEDLVLCPGLGPQKARRLYDALHQPFLKSRKKES